MDRTAVTVLVIGPAAVSGGKSVPDGMVRAAIDAIDDRHVIVDDRVMRVDALWESVIAAAEPDPACRLTLVCPGWWSGARVARVRRAAGPDREIVLRRRHDVHRPGGCRLEIAPEFVLYRSGGRQVAAIPRSAAGADVARAVVAAVAGCGPVSIDAPTGVDGAADLAAAIARGLRERGRDVEQIDDATLCAAVPDDRPGAGVRRTAVAWVVAASALLTGAALLGSGRSGPPAAVPVALLTEGRVTVLLPVDWEITRITDGAGSPRVQADSPDHPMAAILLTQSPAGSDPARNAAVLKGALDRQPVGVFTDFRAADRRGGRVVTSYTERRDDREIAWAVFVDGPVRIAIGCQQPADGAQPIREHCDEALRSARSTP